jgi:hypothetical protein
MRRYVSRVSEKKRKGRKKEGKRNYSQEVWIYVGTITFTKLP